MTRLGSLCSGYGGLDLAVSAALGAKVVWHVEYDRDPARILEHHWPDVPNHGDVKATDWRTVEPVDILTAGYPCQPFSHAGKRKGSDDPRHLWPDVARAIGVLRPRLVVLENVRGHVSLGLADVLGDLSGLGYDATWGLVRAADAGAPHERARIFIAATDARGGSLPQPAAARHGLPIAAERRYLTAAHAHCDGCARLTGIPAERGAVHGDGGSDADRRSPVVEWGAYAPAVARWERVTGRPAPDPTEPGRNGPRLAPVFVEWMMGLTPGHVTDPAVGISRAAQLKALGNGVVPQQAALALQLLGVTA